MNDFIIIIHGASFLLTRCRNENQRNKMQRNEMQRNEKQRNEEALWSEIYIYLKRHKSIKASIHPSIFGVIYTLIDRMTMFRLDGLFMYSRDYSFFYVLVIICYGSLSCVVIYRVSQKSLIPYTPK